MKEFVREYLSRVNIEINDRQAQQFEKYGNMLREWNTVMNLTGITDKREIVIKHFADSVIPLSIYDFRGKSVIDIGTGAGFPGFPLKIAEPSVELTLMDSLLKRINFLKTVGREAEIEAEYVHGRAEDFGQDSKYRGQYDIAVSRAVAPLNVLAEYSLPFLKEGGVFIALKGPGVYDEIERSRNALCTLGGSISDLKLVALPDTDINHSVLVIEKTGPTPENYPRRSKKIERSPL